MRANIFGKEMFLMTTPPLKMGRALRAAETLVVGSASKFLTIAVLGFISIQSIPATAGDVTGPNAHTDQVLANTTDVYEMTFKENEIAQVGVVGDGDTDLDLYIYDENDNLIGSDLDASDLCYVEWTPSWTGKYTIKIKNLGDVYNEYFMITN